MKTKIYFIFLAFTVFCSIMLFGARTIEGVWFWELPVSFLPLMTIGLAMLFIIAFIGTAFHFRKLPKRVKNLHTLIIGSALFIIFSSTVLSIIQVTTVLDNTVLAHERDLEATSVTEIRVGFFNKYYYNNKYQPILAAVTANHLDIFGMAELSEAEYQVIKEHIDLEYSYYTNCYCHDELSDPVAIFSRYPLSDIHTDGFKDSGIIETLATINATTTVNVIVIHPDAPMTPAFLSRRNELIHTIDTIIQKYRDKPVILMGDFNLSNWSPTYNRFLTNNAFLKNSSRGFGILSSWGPRFMRSMIDHIFVSQNIAVKGFAVESIEGSDHDMIWTRLGL